MLEKIYGRAMNIRAFLSTRSRIGICLLAMYFLLMPQTPAQAQLQAGAAYLKIIPGARQQGIYSSLTGAVDNMYAIYANPGATGLLREWQLSASRTEWIPEVHNTAFYYGTRLHTPWSRHSRVALTAAYLGVPDFDSTNDRAPQASGGDLLLTASFGQPIHALQRHLAFGGSIKYLRTDLNGARDNTLAFDAGVMARTPRFRFLRAIPGLFDFAVFSAGVAITNLGRPLKFVNAETPLPRTFRAGLALNTGTHEGLQWHLTADYRGTRDEQAYWTFGTELSYAQILTVRYGYNFEEDNVLRHYAIGASIGLNDVRPVLARSLPLQNKALRLDLVALQDNVFFRAPYRGSAGSYPIRPEVFDFAAPAPGAAVATTSPELRWEVSRDPDLFDEVRYWLMVDADSLALQATLDRLKSENRVDLLALLEHAPPQVMVSEMLLQHNFALNSLECEDYYWTIVAYDLDHHYRIVGQDSRRIARFRVALPDLQITALDLLQPDLGAFAAGGDSVRITIENAGAAPARNIPVDVRMAELPLLAAADVRPAVSANLIPAALPSLAPGEVWSTTIPLESRSLGGQALLVHLDRNNTIAECDTSNNRAVLDLPPAGSDLRITKASNCERASPGDTCSYTLTVYNGGPAMARDAVLADVLPAYLHPVRFSRNPDTLSVTGGRLVWKIDSLAVSPPSGEGAPFVVEYEAVIDDIPFAMPPLFAMDSVVFDFNISGLTPYARRALDAYASKLEAYLQANPGVRVEIGGHTDNVGRAGYNDTLSVSRAQSVMDYLAARSEILAARLVVKGYGERVPLVPNDNEDCRRLNRRVEGRILDAPAQPSGRRLRNVATVWSASDTDTSNNRSEATVTALPAPQIPESALPAVRFDFDKSGLRAAATDAIDRVIPQLIRVLASDSTLCIEVAGHTDSRGSEAYNDGLSRERAAAVVQYLREHCIWPNRIFPAGYGESQPVATNDTAAGRQLNRRVEFRPHRGEACESTH